MVERAQEPIVRERAVSVSPPAREPILALDIRPSMFGFAALEGSSRLLDWGMRRIEKGKRPLRTAVTARILPLLDFHRPGYVVVRSRNYHSAALNRRRATIVDSIRGESIRQSIKFRKLTTRQVRRQLLPGGSGTKYQIAAQMAKHFEALSWRLSHPRKPYQSESVAMLVFDAVAVGMAFLTLRE